MGNLHGLPEKMGSDISEFSSEIKKFSSELFYPYFGGKNSRLETFCKESAI